MGNWTEGWTTEAGLNSLLLWNEPLPFSGRPLVANSIKARRRMFRVPQIKEKERHPKKKTEARAYWCQSIPFALSWSIKSDESSEIPEGPSEAQKDVCHRNKFSLLQLAAALSMPESVPLPQSRHTLTTQPLPAYISFQLQPSVSLLLSFNDSLATIKTTWAGAFKLGFCLFNIQPGEYTSDKSMNRRTFLNLLFHRPSSVLLKGHFCISSRKFSVYKTTQPLFTHCRFCR